MLSKPWRPDKNICDLRLLVSRMNASANEQEDFARITLEVDEGPTVRVPVDPAFFEQILWNLLHNAADSMPEGGEIRYQVTEEGGFAQLTVSDSGTGVPAHLHDRLFRPFFTTKSRGTGLGLPICKKIMEAHGGSIEIESDEGQGTQVILRFPL